MSLHTFGTRLQQWLKHKRAHGILVVSEWKNIVIAARSSWTYWLEIVLKIFKNKIKYTFIYEKLLSSLKLSAIVWQRKWHVTLKPEGFNAQCTGERLYDLYCTLWEGLERWVLTKACNTKQVQPTHGSFSDPYNRYSITKLIISSFNCGFTDPAVCAFMWTR